jgi:cytoskeletal protein RodZ
LLHLGTFLREAREDKNLSLEDMQELTKIKIAYLVAIEQGNYDALPGIFYVRAFVKTYCEALGLPSAEVMDIYQSDLPGSNHNNHNNAQSNGNSHSMIATDSEPPVILSVEKNSPHFFTKWGSSIVIWSFAIIILLAIYFLITGTESNEKPSTSNEKTEQTKINEQTETEDKDQAKIVVKKNETDSPESNEPTPVEDTQSDNQTENDTGSNRENVSNEDNSALKVTKKENNATYYQVKQRDKVVIQITAKDELYVHYGPTDKSKIYGLEELQAGQSVTWDNDENTLLRVGNMENLQLTVNGVLVSVGDYSGERTLYFNLK